MTTLKTKSGFITYEQYLKKFEEWVNHKESSSLNASPALIEFTKLNWTRTQRLHKTISLLPELKMAVTKIQHTYTWVLLTEAWCGDSAQNLPVIAEIAKLNPGKIKLNIQLRDENPELMDKYLTDGTSAIPKVIAFDDLIGKEVFVWGPRPAPAQALLKLWKANPAAISWDEFEKELHSWYATNKTQTIQQEFTLLLNGML